MPSCFGVYTLPSDECSDCQGWVFYSFYVNCMSVVSRSPCQRLVQNLAIIFNCNSQFPLRQFHLKLETCQCCVYSKRRYWHGAKEFIFSLEKIIIHESPFAAKITDHPKCCCGLSLDQNRTRQRERLRRTIPGENATLMGFRHCWCLTGLFGLSLVPLFMKPLSKKKPPDQTRLVLLVLDNRKLHLNKIWKLSMLESFCELFIVR